MDWKTYEEVVKKIYEALGKDKGVTIDCWGNNCKVKGKSDVDHQIDVLTSFSDGLHIYKTAIECKYWNETINKDIVMKVQGIINDANITKGIIVSKLGFTPDAIKYAKQTGIGLVELRELTDKDWEGRLKKVTFNIQTLLPNIERMDFITEDREGDIGQVTGDTISTFNIHTPNGEITNVFTLAQEFHTQLLTRTENEKCKKVFPFPEGSKVIDKTGNLNVNITGVLFLGSLRIDKKVIAINARNHIWLYMKAIFEDKSFAISKDGVIEEMLN